MLPAIPKPLTPLVELLLEQSVEAQHFLSNTEAYNSAFQTASFECDEIKARTGWNPCFKVQGQIYHSIGSLASPENSTAKFAQIYFVGDVMTSMIHGSCGPLNKNAPCMVDSYCSKHFPKNFCRETQCSNDGYPLYRRPLVSPLNRILLCPKSLDAGIVLINLINWPGRRTGYMTCGV